MRTQSSPNPSGTGSWSGMEFGSQEQKAEAAHNRLDYVEKRIELLEINIKKITDMMPSLVATNKVLIFIAGALGLSVVGLIWSLIIGQVQLVFP